MNNKRSCTNCSCRFCCEDVDDVLDAECCPDYAKMRDIDMLEYALREAMDWNWLDADAEENIPEHVRELCKGALRLCERRRADLE